MLKYATLQYQKTHLSQVSMESFPVHSSVTLSGVILSWISWILLNWITQL